MKLTITNRKSEEFEFVMDSEDLEKFNSRSWYIQKTKEGVYVSCRETYLHRFLMNCPNGLVVDHINGDTLDNRKVNLRVCTSSQNNINRAKKPGCISKYKGVHFDKSRNRFVARLDSNGRTIRLGRFMTEEEAGRAYDIKAKEVYGDFAVLNFNK